MFPVFALSKIQNTKSSSNTTEHLEFCMKKRYSNLLEGITEIFPTFLNFLSGLENFGTADVKTALNDCKFRENQRNKSHTLLRCVHPYFLHLLSNLGLYKRPAHKTVKHAFENHENRRKKDHTFLTDVNQITFTHTLTNSDVQQAHPRKVGILSHSFFFVAKCLCIC
jgi:hypothetical protein